MNSFTVATTLISQPIYNYSPDNISIATVFAKFYSPYEKEDGTRSESQIKIVGWGKLAEIINSLTHGQQCIISGRLRMNTVERAEGFKEKRAELVAQSIYPI